MMNTYWQKFSEKFSAMAQRERAMTLLAVLALIYLLWTLVFLAPVSEDIERLRAQKQTLDSRVLDLQAQEQVFSQTAGTDPNASKKRQIDHLQKRLEALDEDLQALAVGLVPAEMLPQVLHDVLSNTGKLELQGMQTLPVEKLTITGADAAGEQTAVAANQQVDVYRHGVEVQVSGNYFSIAEYLKELEALPWRFYWDRLDYQVGDYPQAIATLEVYTLSAGEGLLGD